MEDLSADGIDDIAEEWSMFIVDEKYHVNNNNTREVVTEILQD